jgi:putative DNA primase/helicase
METFVASRTERHPTDLAMLRGARCVSAQETEEGQRWAESRIKALTGGDPVTARYMRQDFFTYIPSFKLLIAGNHKPALRNVDEAMRRRLHLIPFAVTIPKSQRDPHLAEKLKAEYGGILAWAIEGCLEWQKQGLAPPSIVLQATEGYFSDEDALGRFIEECIAVVDPQNLIEVQMLFDDWKRWCERTNEYCGNIKRFSQNLESRGFERCKDPKTRRASFRGIELIL